MEYAIGALIIEMEKCPLFGCGACFEDPLTNFAHQDSIHHSVSVRLCGVCRGVYVSKGAFIHHVVHGHGSIANFEQEMDRIYRPRSLYQVSYDQ